MSVADEKKPEVVLSFDVETTGPSPLIHSCVMIGIAVIIHGGSKPVSDDTTDQWLVERKQWCIKEYNPRDPITWAEFWIPNRKVWQFIEMHAQDVRVVMQEFADWYRQLISNYRGRKIRWLAMPASFDWQWLHGVYTQFGPADKPNIGYKATCLSSMMDFCVQTTGIKTDDLSKQIYSTKLKHTHMAADDAVGQGYAYLKLLERSSLTT